MDSLTTQQLLDKLGLKSSRTLRHWRSLGLIGNPKIVSHPDGRGRIAQWPSSVLSQCLDLREKLQSGESLEEIAASKKKLGYQFKNDWERRGRHLALLHLRDGVLKSLRRLGRDLVSKLDPELITPEHLAEAQDLVCNGQVPLLVLFENGSAVITESQLTLLTAGHPESGLFVLVSIGPFLDSNDRYPDE